MLTVFLILVILALIASVYVNYNLYSKYNTLEETAKENVDFILSIRARVLSQRSYLKQLDRKGAFESDDEIGYFFKELKKIVNDIATYLEMEPDSDGDSQEEQIIRSRITSEF